MKRRGRWGLAVVVLAASISVWFILRQQRPIAAARTIPSRHATTARASAPPSAIAANEEPSAPTTELCGLGRVSLDTDDPLAISLYVRRATQNARARWEAALLDSDDNRARAAGLYLEGKLPAENGIQSITEASRDALVQFAVGAGDPAVYAIAVHACDTYDNAVTSASCQQITLRAWANMDPGNAVPWLMLSGFEHARGNLAAEADAFARASQATKVDSYAWSLFAFAKAEMPSDMTPLERWEATVELTGIEGAMAEPQYRVATTRCANAPPQDQTLRDECNALAETFVSKGTTLVDLSMGIAMGTHSGWSPTRLAGLRQERDALMQASRQAFTPPDGNEWSCDGVRRGNAYMEEWSQLGEIGAAREIISQSGDTQQELAKKHADYMEKLMREAQRQTLPTRP